MSTNRDLRESSPGPIRDRRELLNEKRSLKVSDIQLTMRNKEESSPMKYVISGSVLSLSFIRDQGEFCGAFIVKAGSHLT